MRGKLYVGAVYDSTDSIMKAAVSFAIVFLVTTGFLRADWPRFQGPNLLGTSEETNLDFDWGEAGPKIAWSLELNEGFGGAAIAGDEVFFLDRVPGEADVLRCVALADGSDRWMFQSEQPGRLQYPGSRGVPSVESDAVYFIAGFGQVHRINRETHEADWVVNLADRYGAQPPRWGWVQSPLIVGDLVIVAPMSEEVGLAALNKETGAEVWRSAPFGDSHSTPTLIRMQGVDQIVFIGVKRDGDGGVGTTIGVDPASGEEFWRTTVYFNKIPIPFPTKIDEERLYLTGGYGCGSAMIRLTKNGNEWEVEKLWDSMVGTQIHPPFVIGEHLYFLANENANHRGENRETGGLACMALSGEIVWQTGNDPFMGRGGSLLAGDKLLVQDGETGYLRVFEPSPEGPELLAEADIFGKRAEVEEQIKAQEGRKRVKLPDFQFWSPMALSDGRLVMRGQTMLKCVDLRP